MTLSLAPHHPTTPHLLMRGVPAADGGASEALPAPITTPCASPPEALVSRPAGGGRPALSAVLRERLLPCPACTTPWRAVPGWTGDGLTAVLVEDDAPYCSCDPWVVRGEGAVLPPSSCSVARCTTCAARCDAVALTTATNTSSAGT